MKMKKCLTVFFYAVDPGAFNIMQPIFRLAPDSTVCCWAAEGYAKDVLNSRNVKSLSVDDVLSKDSRDMGVNAILIIGSQMNTDRTTRILSQSKGTCLKTMFIFDHWSNYHKHFKLPQGGYVFPDKVLVMDEFCGEKVKSTKYSSVRIQFQKVSCRLLQEQLKKSGDHRRSIFDWVQPLFFPVIQVVTFGKQSIFR